jgi:hypothetical protein
MAHEKIVDLSQDDFRKDIEEEGNNEELDNLENEIQGNEHQENSFELPEKFRGKSPEEIAKAYMEVEKTVGRQGAELGQMRKYVDSLIQREINVAPEKDEPAKPVDADDLLDRPEETIREIIKKELKGVTEQLNHTQHQLQFNDFVRKHPDYTTVAQSPEFLEWVQSSDRRMSRYQSANYEMDLEAADELLSDWKELSSFRQQKAQEAETKRKKALKDVTAERGAGESGQTSKRKFRRSELREMRIHNPDKFDAMQSEIIAAYREGRVIDG